MISLRMGAAIALAAGLCAAAEVDLKVSGYKPQVVIGKTAAVEVMGKDGPLEGVEITPADGLTVAGVRAKEPAPGRSLAKDVKLWEFQLAVAAGAKAGERSVVLKTPAGAAEPGTIVLVPYKPVIQSLKVVSAKGVDAEVQIEMTVQDAGAKLGTSPGVNTQMMCGNRFAFSIGRASKVVPKTARTAVVHFTSSQPNSRASGTCEFAITISNEPGYESDEWKGKVTFE